MPLRQFLHDLPPAPSLICYRIYYGAAAVGGLGILAEKVVPDSPTGWGLLVTALVALIGAIGAQADQWRKRQMQIDAMKAQIETQLATGKRAITRNTRKIEKVEKRQDKLDSSIKDLELLRDIGGFVQGPDAKKSILIVDDDPLTLNRFSKFLARNLGPFNILLADSVEAAMRLLRCGPDYMFLDLKLGSDSGLQLVPHAKSYNPAVKIIAITGLNDPNELEGALALSVDIWRKPLSKTDVNRLLGILQEDFGAPPPSSDAIPTTAASGLLPPVPGDGGSDG